MEEKFISKVTAISTSKYALIPYNVIRAMQLNPGDAIKVTITKLSHKKGEEMYAFCNSCHNAIIVNDGEDIVDCPHCDETELHVSDLEVWYGEL